MPQGGSSKIVYPYLIPTMQNLEKNYMKTLVLYAEEVKDMFIDALKVDLRGVTILESPQRSSGKDPYDDEDVYIGENSSDHARPSKKASVIAKPHTLTFDNVEFYQRLSGLEDGLKIVVDFVNEEKKRSANKKKKDEKGKAHVHKSLHQPIQNLEAAQTLVDVAAQVPGEEVAQNENLSKEREAYVTNVVPDQVTGAGEDEELIKVKTDDVLVEEAFQNANITNMVLNGVDGEDEDITETKADDVLTEDVIDEVPAEDATNVIEKEDCVEKTDDVVAMGIVENINNEKDN